LLTRTQNKHIFERTSFPWKQHSTDVLLGSAMSHWANAFMIFPPKLTLMNLKVNEIESNGHT